MAHITIPKDLQEWTTSDDDRSSANIKSHSGVTLTSDLASVAAPLPSQEQLRQAADIINAGSKVVILAGRA
ncbi:MAG TPA: hypothetical protein VH393_17610 [Ktedonobacterales bacterium]